MQSPFNRNKLPGLAMAITMLISTASFAQSVQVKDPWVRGTVASQKVTGAFMTLTAEKSRKLVAASSSAAGLVEIHEMKMDGGVMRMRPLTGLELPAGQPVELKPGGYHVMLMDLKQPLAAGQMVSIELTLEAEDGQRSTISVQAPVRPLSQPAGTMMHKH